MPENQVLLEVQIAESIFSHLMVMNNALKESGLKAGERLPLMRDMVKIKVAINTSKGLY